MNESTAPSSSPGVVVLGMHRSGTSLLTSLLEAAGFFVGESEEVFPPQSCNEEGFWERKDVVELNEWLFGCKGRNDPPWPSMSGWLQNQIVALEDLTAAEALTFQTKAGNIHHRLSENGHPWAMKDPRLCLTYSCWADLLKPSAIILMHRNPLEVAASLHKRDGLPTAFSMAMWELHLQASLNASLGSPRFLLSMDSLFSDPRQVMRDLLAFLRENGITTALPADRLPYESLIKPGLVHQKRPTEDPYRDLTNDQQQLLRCLKSGNLPEQAQSISPNCLNTLSEFRYWINTWAGTRKDITRLTSKIRLMEEALGFYGGLAWHYQSLAVCCRENLERNLATNTPSLTGRLLRRFTEARSDHSTRLEQTLEELKRRETALGQSRMNPPPSPPQVAVVLQVEDKCWLSSALKTYGQSGCGTLLVTSSVPGMGKAVQDEITRTPLPPNLVFHFCECPDFQAPALPPAVVEFLIPLKPDWILAPKANEFLSPPREYASLPDWLLEMGNLSLRRVSFQEYAFLPCRESPAHLPETFRETLRWYYPLGSTPRRDLGWRFPGTAAPPNPDDIPEGLRREQAPHNPGILRTYLFLNPSQAPAQQGYPPGSPPPSLPSVADLYYDDGLPEHLNPCPLRITHLPLFEKSGRPA